MTEQKTLNLPVLPLRDTVFFPGLVSNLRAGREHSVAALNACMDAKETPRLIFMVAQREEQLDNPSENDLYEIGVVAHVLQMVQGEPGIFRLLVEAKSRAKVEKIFRTEGGYFQASVTELDSVSRNKKEEINMASDLLDLFKIYAKERGAEVRRDVMSMIGGLVNKPDRLTDIVIPYLIDDIAVKQGLLEELSVKKRLKATLDYIDKEMSAFKIERRLRTRVKKQMEKSQREYYLNEHMKAIQSELSEIDGGHSEHDELEKRIRAAEMPEAALEKSLAELNKLKMMSPVSAEASVSRGYLDWMVNVPWNKRDEYSKSLESARTVLDEDHYGLDDVKDRIMEHLAVHKRKRKIRGSIICLVGPPGVGKTSLGRSIARGTNRQYIRLSLGGVRDEAEIRGHRRTYIGAMPGKIIQKMSDVGTVNPLFLLDEIDKVGMDYRGDPAAALLEVLDPEQNHAFNDHYLEVDYNLSEVLFICTANTLSIPPALLDRMEIIRLPGYTEEEKQIIAERYLLPRQISHAGLKKSELKIKPTAIRDLIRHYTREAGVRELDRHISKICRKVLLQHSLSAEQDELNSSLKKTRRRSCTVSGKNLDKYCGAHKFESDESDKLSRIGQASGLAWTGSGGDMLIIEAAVLPGKGRKVLTGSLGAVMKESVAAALTVARNYAELIGIEHDMDKTDVHVHAPAGATPKDGPSAGICMCIALLSVLSKIPVKQTVAMTGEITLQGKVLPIGGLKEKLLAARRANIDTVVIPARNQKDLAEIPEDIKSSMKIVTVSWIDEVLQHAMEHIPIDTSAETLEKLRGIPAPEAAGKARKRRIATSARKKDRPSSAGIS